MKSRKILQDVNIGGNLRKLRKDKHFTQCQLVTQMQLRGSTICRSTYNNIELGTRNIKITDLNILKKIYNISYDDFFKGIDEQISAGN